MTLEERAILKKAVLIISDILNGKTKEVLESDTELMGVFIQTLLDRGIGIGTRFSSLELISKINLMDGDLVSFEELISFRGRLEARVGSLLTKLANESVVYLGICVKRTMVGGKSMYRLVNV